jgi:dTDP-4-dehydrorhamnose reductase
MRVTIFGATGLLGKALVKEWRDDTITALGSSDADIRVPEAVHDAVQQSRPDWIVLAAAYTDVDDCETHREFAFDVNTRGAVNVARAAKAVGSRLLFLSSDYVFDGEKTTPYEIDDPRAPRSVYGRSKADAEEGLLTLIPDCCIVRTSWVFGVGGKCFPDTILKLAATHPELEVVNDQRGCPTYTVDLARCIRDLCHREAQGIVHATNSGDCTWFELAAYLLTSAGSATVVRPTTTDRFPRPAERPKYAVLSPSSLERFDRRMPAWQDAVARYLDERSR